MAFLYPTAGAWLFAVDSMDTDLAAALVRAYNRWLHEFCSHDPGFLRPVGAVCRHDPAEMVAELHRFAGLGWRAVYLRPNPIRGRVLSDPAYEQLWSACERLDVAVSIHEGTHARVPTAGADRFNTRFAMHACSHPLEQMMALLALIEGGVLERHPGLRVGFLEAGCGWLPYWLWRLDEEYEQLGWEVKRNVKQKPSAYFRRQCFVSVEPSEPYLDRIVDLLGEDSLLFGSDYPHMDHGPGALGDLIQKNAMLPPRVMRKMLWDNPRRFYGLGP
jgi:predicted TIM-barrel fold metal-dependent hydrolase